MEGPCVELKGGYKMSASLHRKLTNIPLGPLFEGKDNFVCSDLSSSDDLPNPNYVHITMCSVPSTPESTPAVSGASKEAANLGFSGEKPPPPEKKVNSPEVVLVSSDDDEEEEESDSVEELSGDSEEDTMEFTSVKLAEEASKPSPTAMECLVELLSILYETDEHNVDILKTAKRSGITFPRNRGYDS